MALYGTVPPFQDPEIPIETTITTTTGWVPQREVRDINNNDTTDIKIRMIIQPNGSSSLHQPQQSNIVVETQVWRIQFENQWSARDQLLK